MSKDNQSISQDCLNYQSNLQYLDSQIKKHTISIEEIGDYMPGNVMVQDLFEMKNSYMNKCGCEFLRHTSEELNHMGPDYFETFFPKDEVKVLKPRLMQFISLSDPNKVLSFFQNVKGGKNAEFSTFLTTSRIELPIDGDGPVKLINIAVPMPSLDLASKKIYDIVGRNEQYIKDYERFTTLSAREKEIIKYIVEGKSSYEISEILCRSLHTVNTHRKNIVAKIGSSSLAHITRFALCFDLV